MLRLPKTDFVALADCAPNRRENSEQEQSIYNQCSLVGHWCAQATELQLTAISYFYLPTPRGLRSPHSGLRPNCLSELRPPRRNIRDSRDRTVVTVRQ